MNSIVLNGPGDEFTLYRPVGERIPEFFERYPLGEYQVVRSHQPANEYLAAKDLWETAINNGQNPNDLGLPKPVMVVIFSAALYKGDLMLANASALKPITSPKAWEAGETAAFQRLLAAVGIGGEVLNQDEAVDRRQSGLEGDSPDENPFVQAEGNDAEASQEEELGIEKPEPEAQPEKTQGNTTQKSATRKSSTQKSSPKSEPDNESEPAGVKTQLIKQLEHHAALAGESVPEVSSDEEAKKEIKRLKVAARNT